jgi:hypothetical protein
MLTTWRHCKIDKNPELHNEKDILKVANTIKQYYIYIRKTLMGLQSFCIYKNILNFAQASLSTRLPISRNEDSPFSPPRMYRYDASSFFDIKTTGNIKQPGAKQMLRSRRCNESVEPLRYCLQMDLHLTIMHDV